MNSDNAKINNAATDFWLVISKEGRDSSYQLFKFKDKAMNFVEKQAREFMREFMELPNFSLDEKESQLEEPWFEFDGFSIRVMKMRLE
jgi:hypothetical protein